MILFLIALTMAFSLCVPAGAADGNRLEFADGLYARGMHEVAAKEYGAYLEEFPDTDKADVIRFRLGECYRHLGNLAAAEREFRTLFTEYPDSLYRLRAGFRRADLFMEAEQYADAADLFQAVLRENPPPDLASASLFFLGAALARLGRTDEAEKAFDAVVAEHQDTKYHSYALLKLGELYRGPLEIDENMEARAADLDKALSFLEQAAAKPASDRIAAEALFQIAEIHFRRGAYARSAEAYGVLLETYPSDDRSEEARLQATWAAHNAKLYFDALARCDEVLDGDLPAAKRPEWLYLKANCERQLLKYDEAVSTYAVLLREDPSGPFANAARYERALTFYRRGMFDEARNEALKVDLNSDLKKDVYWLLGESFSALKEEDRAIQYYRLLIEEFPKSDLTCEASYRLANHLRSKGEYKEASRYYNIVAADYPENELAPRSLLASGYCLREANMDAEAVRDWTRLIRNYPSSPLIEDALYRKFMGEVRLDRLPEALDSIDELLAVFPKTKFLADAHYWRGSLLERQEKMQDAESAFRECLAASPGKDLERAAKFSLAHILYRAGKHEEAADIFSELVASPLRNKLAPELVRWLADTSIERKNFDVAIKAAETLVETREEPAWRQIGWGLMGRAEYLRGRIREAEERFRACLDIEAKTSLAAEAALRLAEIGFEKGDIEDARDYFEKAADLSSGDELLNIRARAYAGLGRVAEEQERFGSAARSFMYVAILFDDPDLVPECLHKAAQAFRKIGREDEAARAEQELVERYPESRWAAAIREGG